MLVGLLVSLLIKRRRVWARITPLTGPPGDGTATADVRRSVVEMAGLARTDQAGWGEGFGDMVADLLDLDPDANKKKPGGREQGGRKK